MSQVPLTVMMPVYNAGPYLRGAIESILSQTFRDFEFLIINDGSQDNSVEIIKSYADPRIRLVHNEYNQGLISTLNKGLDLVRTRYVARMDADDLSRPDRLDKQLQVMRQGGDIIACGTAYQKFGRQDHALFFPGQHEEIYCGLLFTPTLAHAAVMLNMDLMNQGGFRFDPDYHHAEDYELWSRLGERHRLANLGEILYEYRMHDTQVSFVHSEVQTDNSLRVQRRMLRRLGFEPSRQEMDLHRTLFVRDKIQEFQYLTSVGDWFDKILLENEICRHFDKPALLKYMSRIWFSRAYQCCQSGTKTCLLYFGKPYAMASLKNRIKLIVSCALKRK